MSKKSIQVIDKAPSRKIRTVPIGRDEYLHINSTPIASKEAPKPIRWTLALLALTIAFTLFLLAYAGPAIGNVLGYIVIPALGVFPGLLVGERFGKVSGVLAGLLLVTVLTPAYGNTIIANSISMFTSLQMISQGILVFLGILFFLGSLLLILLRKSR